LRFGDEVSSLRLHLDGCPHSCAQHWVGDLGFQGTTARDTEGKRRPAYDVFVRGGLGPGAQIGRPLFRRVLTEDLNRAVEGLVGAWITGRQDGEDFMGFTRRLGDDDLGALAGLEPSRGRAARDEEG
jgi:sulfite reductase beta subunit-like hemoprotein